MLKPSPWFRLPDTPAASPKRISIIGAGLAGCFTAREFAERGWSVTVFDAAEHAATQASANTAALLRPHVTRDETLASRFFGEGFDACNDRLQRLINSGHRIQHELEGVLLLLQAAARYPENPLYQFVSQTDASKRAGLAVNAPALFCHSAGWINLPDLCCALLDHAQISLQAATRITNLELVSSQNDNDSPTWRLTDQDHIPYLSQHVVLACGIGLGSFDVCADLPISPVRGQITQRDNPPDNKLTLPVCGRSYAVPVGDRLVLGSTYDRNDRDLQIRPVDHEANLASWQHLFAQPLAADPSTKNTASDLQCEGWVGIRASSPDRLPVLGPMPDMTFYREQYHSLHHGRRTEEFPGARYWPGLYINGAYGSRGTNCAGRCAELLADYVCHRHRLPTPEHTAQTEHTAQSQSVVGDQTKNTLKYLELLHPARFLIRQLKKAPAHRQP